MSLVTSWMKLKSCQTWLARFSYSRMICLELLHEIGLKWQRNLLSKTYEKKHVSLFNAKHIMILVMNKAPSSDCLYALSCKLAFDQRDCIYRHLQEDDL